MYKPCNLSYFQFAFFKVTFKHPFFSTCTTQQCFKIIYSWRSTIKRNHIMKKLIFNKSYRGKFFKRNVRITILGINNSLFEFFM